VSDVCHPERSAAGHPERSATGHPERSAAGHPERSGGSLSSGREILRRFTPQDDTSGRFTALDDDARDRKKIIASTFSVPYFATRPQMAFLLRPRVDQQPPERTAR
jgi:hypothetical protein